MNESLSIPMTIWQHFSAGNNAIAAMMHILYIQVLKYIGTNIITVIAVVCRRSVEINVVKFHFK